MQHSTTGFDHAGTMQTPHNVASGGTGRRPLQISIPAGRLAWDGFARTDYLAAIY
jgi:hypothetical protein